MSMIDQGPAPRIGFLLSGTGRTLQNLLEHIANGRLAARIVCVVSDREGVYGLERAEQAGIPHIVEPDAEKTFAYLREHQVELVCLGGYLRRLPVPRDFAGRIINIHPALLPKFGGKGYYGDRVHCAVLEAGEAESGCTVHYCDEQYDTGPIILQTRVPVQPDDTVETLAERVFAAECETYPEAIRRWTQDRREASK